MSKLSSLHDHKLYMFIQVQCWLNKGLNYVAKYLLGTW